MKFLLRFINLMVVAAMSIAMGGSRQKQEVTLATGETTGVYYPVGQAIAQAISQAEGKPRLEVQVLESAGSVNNLNGVLSGQYDFALAQADRVFQAVKGTAEWESKGEQRELRSVFSLYPEAVTLVASEKSGIKKLEDLKGKKVAIGSFGSGIRGIVLEILRAAQIDHEKDFTAENIRISDAPEALRQGDIDAFFYAVGHPSSAIERAGSGDMKVRLISLPHVESLLEATPYFSPATIDKQVYPDFLNEENTQTVEVLSMVLTSASTDEDLVYAFTKSIFEQMEVFREAHPALQGLTRQRMLEGLIAPVHPGAVRYFREVGLMN